MSLNIIFAGTPEFAVPSLQALIDSNHTVVAVYTQPDRPAGRGQQLQASPVKLLAQKHNIPVYQPRTLRDPIAQEQLRALSPDLMVVVAYGLLLPEAVLAIPRLGCVNVHPSLLPRWRGAAPIQRTIAAGDSISGVTIMQLDAGMDTGPILKQASHPLSGHESSADLHDFFATMGAALLLETVDGLEVGRIKSVKQDDLLATHANKIQKEEAIVNWQMPASEIACLVRAFNPWPVTHTTFNDMVLRIWSARPVMLEAEEAPGVLTAIDKEGFCVATGQGLLKVLSVQVPGKKQMSAVEFVRGYASQLKIGQTQFGKPL